MRRIPVRDLLLVRLILEEKSPGGIVIPTTVQGETAIGEVIDKGGGKVSQNGETIPMCVSRRDKIEFSKHGMIKTQSEGEDLYLIREDSIICVIMD